MGYGMQKIQSMGFLSHFLYCPFSVSSFGGFLLSILPMKFCMGILITPVYAGWKPIFYSVKLMNETIKAGG